MLIIWLGWLEMDSWRRLPQKIFFYIEPWPLLSYFYFIYLFFGVFKKGTLFTFGDR